MIIVNLFIWLGLLFSSRTFANVIGIDFGGDNIKVGMISPGKFDIVTNFQSKRRTPNNIAFYQGERLYGSDAYALMARKPESVFSKFFRMIGKTITHPRITELKKQYYPYELYTNETTSIVRIPVGETSYSSEELLAMMMTHIKDMTKEYIGSPVKDCVITVPASFTQHEKHALHTAAEIADLNVLSLIDENTAAALHFGIDRVFDEPHNVLFYNMGSGSIQVSIATYSSYQSKDGSKNKTTGQFQIVGKAWNEEIGGFTFDLVLADILATRFNTNWHKKKNGAGQDIREHVRPMTRLRMDALKIREILSANNEYPYKVEQLHADVDLSTKITRAEFEEAVQTLISKITEPIDQALAMANLTLKDIHAVELLGGGVRMPYVKNSLEAFFKAGNLELGQHLNGDEAMALGATFRGANISTAFRVRKVGVHDLSTFSVSVKFDNLPSDTSNGGLFNWLLGNSKETKENSESQEVWSKHTPLYPGGSPIPSKTKTVAFHHDQNILCRLEYDENDTNWPLPAGTSPLFGVFNITGVSEFAKETASLGVGLPKVHLSFTIDGSGMVVITKAEATLELPTETEESPVESKDETETDSKDEATPTSTTGDNSADTETEPVKEKETTSSKDKKEEKKDEKKDEKKSSSKKSAKKEKKDNVLRKTLVVTPILDAVSPPIWSSDLILEAKNRLKALDQADNARKEKAAALNDLEGYVYKVRNRVRDEEDQLAVVSTSEQREEVIELCNNVEEWLYDEGKNQEVSVYKSKQSSIKSKAEAIFKRFKEHTARPEAVKKATHQLSAVRTLIGEWKDTMPHITQEEKDKLSEIVIRVEAWLKDNVLTQSTLTAFESPAFTSTEVMNQLKPLTAQLDKLLKKPKPAPLKTSNETNSTASANTTSSSSNNTATEDTPTGTEDEKREGGGGSEEAETEEVEPETVHINPEDLRDPNSLGDDEL